MTSLPVRYCGPSVLCVTMSRNSFVSSCIWLKIIIDLEWIGTCDFFHLKKTEMCRVWVFPSFFDKTAWAYSLQIDKLTLNWQNRMGLFTPDLRLNTAQDEGISTNSQTQHWRTTNVWLAMTSSHALFLRVYWVNLVLFFKPWCVLVVLCCLHWHSFYQIGHSTLWRTVVGVNWLTC